MFLFAGAQQPKSFRSQAEVVLLPVTARDGHGGVVRNLVAADFRVLSHYFAQFVAEYPLLMPTEGQ